MVPLLLPLSHRASLSPALPPDSEPLCSEEAELGNEEGVGQEQVLWVDKYAPSHFTELLSDDVSAQCMYCLGGVRLCGCMLCMYVCVHVCVCVCVCVFLGKQQDSAFLVEALG